MKKIVFASAALAGVVSSFNANAANATICNAPSAAASATAPIATGGFVVTAFTPKCSANVYLVGNDATTYYGVGAASKKGKTVFGGSTAGGGVSSVDTHAGSDAGSKADTAATNASSS